MSYLGGILRIALVFLFVKREITRFLRKFLDRQGGACYDICIVKKEDVYDLR